MKVLAINGSPRKNGNTSIIIKAVCEELNKENIETEIISLSDKKIDGCISCYMCRTVRNGKCAVDLDDFMNIYEKMLVADGILLGSPTYFSDVTSEMKALIDRAGFVNKNNDYPLRYKVGAAVVSARRAGAIHTFDTLLHFFSGCQMIIPTTPGWGMVIGEPKTDEEGMRNMSLLGKNMAWLLKRIQ